jgi:hypothetical integral membrane protein (TIGR02206 family)
MAVIHPWPAEMFTPYGTVHRLLLALTVVGAAALIIAGRRRRGTAAEQALSRVFGVVLLVVAIAVIVYRLLPANFLLTRSLPLQLSDLLHVVAGYALIRRKPWSFALTYYWGLTLNIQSILTPDLQLRGHPVLELIAYWAPHILSMWAVIYLVWGLRRHPDWRSWRLAIVVTVGWGLVALGVNGLTGANYGFLNRKPVSSSLLNVLGPWPQYLIAEFVAMVVIWALITWPWIVLDRRRRPVG